MPSKLFYYFHGLPVNWMPYIPIPSYVCLWIFWVGMLSRFYLFIFASVPNDCIFFVGDLFLWENWWGQKLYSQGNPAQKNEILHQKNCNHTLILFVTASFAHQPLHHRSPPLNYSTILLSLSSAFFRFHPHPAPLSYASIQPLPPPPPLQSNFFT